MDSCRVAKKYLKRVECQRANVAVRRWMGLSRERRRRAEREKWRKIVRGPTWQHESREGSDMGDNGRIWSKGHCMPHTTYAPILQGNLGRGSQWITGGEDTTFLISHNQKINHKGILLLIHNLTSSELKFGLPVLYLP